MAAEDGPLHSDQLLDVAVNGLEGVGFEVSQQSKSADLEKVVGYEIIKRPAMIRLPAKKMALLRLSLWELASQKFVQISTLRSLIGVWIFGALLKRELLSIPHAVFHFMEQFEDMLVPWWESARQEVKLMSRLTATMNCHVGSKLLPFCFATDAMGMNDHDMGGYGIVCTKVDQLELHSLLRQGEIQGKSIARLDGSGGAKFPDRALRPTVPFTFLPERLFAEDRWQLLERGRWRFGDHITLGESRAVIRLLERLAMCPKCHDSAVFPLQDNRPTAGSMAKGRSPSFVLNRLLRRKAAYTIAACIRLFLPWVESERQPADQASRFYV